MQIGHETYDDQWMNENMMGPNALRMAEELTRPMALRPGMRVLDLGCGRGLTSVFLARAYGVQVFATDLWIAAGDNWARFCAQGLADAIVPIHADAQELPFASEYFDAIICVDAYHYFWQSDTYFDQKLVPLCKAGGEIGLAFPGRRAGFEAGIPQALLGNWTAEDLKAIRSSAWWEKRLRSERIETLDIQEMACTDAAWDDWLNSGNPHAVNDRHNLQVGMGQWLNLLAVRARKRI